MNLKKSLFKRVSFIFFFLITFFCIKGNISAASFPYDKFDWDKFLEQHKNYWVSTYCEEGSKDCVDTVLKTKEKFYVRLYELLNKYDKKGFFINDNIIIETVFYGLTPDSFADKDKIEEEYIGQVIESSYNVDESVDKDSYIAEVDNVGLVSVSEYFNKEMDTLKTLMNNMIGYTTTCYGYSGSVITSTDDAGNTVNSCSNSNAEIIDGECWVNVKVLKSNYFDSIGLSALFSNDSLEKNCMEASSGYSSYKLGKTTATKEVNEEIYWDFLIHNPYFDNKFQLQHYFSTVLTKTNHRHMSELTSDEYKLYEKDIIEIRERIVKNIKDILGDYGDFAETPNSSWVYVNERNFSYSSTSNNYWWPIGGSEITSNGNIEMAIGDPTSIYVTSPFGTRRNPNKNSDKIYTMHYGIDILGTLNITNVIAAKSGIVVKSTLTDNLSCPDSNDVTSKCGGTYGNHVIVQHSDGTYALYAHLALGSVLVNTGDNVVQGQILGKVGSSGSSTGPHLHFEIRLGGNSVTYAVDPYNYVSSSEPRKTGMSFLTDENGNYIDDGLYTNAIVYIHSWEGTPKSSGNDYIAFDDGYGNVTIGWGVLVSAHKDKFSLLGVNADNIKVGSRVSKEVVDAVERQIIEQMADSIRSVLSNNSITLTSYQFDALLSRVYNCGNGGLTGFADAYNQYGVTQMLYDTYLYKPYTSRGMVSKGLQRRRLGEWLLFSEGQYEITV